MANTVAEADARPIAFTAPIVGAKIKAADIASLPALLNAGLSELGAGSVISQEWPDGQASHAGAIPQVESEDAPLASWIIPVPSDRHVALRVLVRAWRTAGEHDARVIVRSRNEGDEVSADVGAGVASADDWLELDLLTIFGVDVAAPGDTPDLAEVIDVFLESDDAGTSITLVQLAAEIAVLANPGDALVAASVTTGDVTANPLGTSSTIVEDGPLSTPIGFALIDADAALRLRPALACCWSGLSTEYDGVSADDTWMPPHGVITAYRPASCDDRRRYGRWSTEGGADAHSVHLMPADAGSPLIVTDAVPPSSPFVRGQTGGGPLVDEVTGWFAAGAIRDVVARAGCTRSGPYALGQPHVGFPPDAGAIYLAAYSAWVRDPSYGDGLPNPLVPAQVLFAQSVTAESVARLGRQLVWHLTRRSAGMVHHVVDYDRASGPLEHQRPAPLTPTHRLVWTLSPGTRHVAVWVRYQAADLSETLPSISLSLSEFDGDPIDAGYELEAAPTNSLRFDRGVDGDDEWPFREWLTSVRVFDDGSGRVLEVPEESAGARVELTVECVNMRIASISAIELPADVVPEES